MKNVKELVYRFLTDADFFNIYKPIGTEAGGGGQTYIDFQTTFIAVARWETFFSGVAGLTTGRGAKGPKWEFPVQSIGVAPVQPQQILLVYQRRSASVCISSQYLHSRNANRVHAWHPNNGFPKPSNPSDRHQLPRGLAVFLVRTFDNEVWAGWFNPNDPINRCWGNDGARLLLSQMLAAARQPGDAGVLAFSLGQLKLDTSNAQTPLLSGTSAPASTSAKTSAKATMRLAAKNQKVKPRRQFSEQELLDMLFNEDEVEPTTIETKQKTRILKVKQRNQKAVKTLKLLYDNRCQLSGARLTFMKQDGTYYTEAHHLVPLGEGGADDPRNIIIVSPLVHKMLHYASVVGIDLGQINCQPSGEATLKIIINGEEMIITWHSEHAKRVLES